MTIIGIDPGKVHCGVCILQKGEVSYFGTMSPEELITFLEEILQPGITVAYEMFLLYPWKAATKTWSHFPEAELIGVIKYLCNTKGLDPLGTTAAAHKAFKYDLTFNTPHERDAYSIARYAQDIILPRTASKRLAKECSNLESLNDSE